MSEIKMTDSPAQAGMGQGPGLSAGLNTDLVESALALGRRLERDGAMVACAESCTGGLVAAALTEVAGSSVWFDRGFVTYSNAAKRQQLGVSAHSLDQFGAVSETVAREMAQGALGRSDAALALAITGIAGPGGGSPDKPVGTVCFAWALRSQGVWSETLHLPGDRAAVRLKAAMHALRQGLTCWIGQCAAPTDLS
jgi:nicotinamide-nucleotide amidase